MTNYGFANLFQMADTNLSNEKPPTEFDSDDGYNADVARRKERIVKQRKEVEEVLTMTLRTASSPN
jgi:hypothetical protein